MRNKQAYEGVTARLGERIAQLMWRQRVSQTAVARQLGVTQSSVSLRLRGKTPITVDELDVMARMVGTTAVELWAEVSGELVSTSAAAANRIHVASVGEAPQTFLSGTVENANRGPAAAGPLYRKYTPSDSNREPAD